MRLAVLCCLLTVFMLPAIAQKGSGGLNSRGARHVGFNVDGDTRVGQAKIFPKDSSYYYEDDWFVTPGYVPDAAGRGRGVIDNSNAASLKAQLQLAGAAGNISFTKRMSTPPYDIMFYLPPDSVFPRVAPQFWVDGVYFRDYVDTDATSFLTGAKNGSNPNTWNGGTSSVSGKADIVDAYCHVRTSGINPRADSVWFFGGLSTRTTDGARYFDIEVYREPINLVNNKFVSQGTSYGHSHWAFDNNSNIIQTGDLVISVAYANNGAPEIDFRIWLKKSTYDSIRAGSIVPKAFKLDGKWDAADDPNFGYAQITAPNETDIWGTGLGNYTGSASDDSTYSTPWGTINTKGVWSETYEQLQFVEISLNFSRFGMNPFAYVTSFCKSPYSSILFKSRNSPEFNASLNDFVGPVDFSVKHMAPFTVTPQVLTCTKDTSNLFFNFDARNYYRLLDENGDTLRKDVDFFMYPVAGRVMKVTKPGTYRVEATNFQGCPTMGYQTVTVLKDDIAPEPIILIGNEGAQYKLIGNATTATGSFGPSQGYTYAWDGPTGSQLSSYTIKEPLITTYVEGTYGMTVTEMRNGCTARTTAYVMGVLKSNFQLSATANGSWNELVWNNPDAGKAIAYVIERSYDGTNFYTVGQANFNSNSPALLMHRDVQLPGKEVYYRVKSNVAGSVATYSNIAYLAPNTGQSTANIYKKGNSIEVQVQNSTAKNILVQVLDVSGRLVAQQNVSAAQGTAKVTIALPAVYQNKTLIVSLSGDGRFIQSKKVF